MPYGSADAARRYGSGALELLTDEDVVGSAAVNATAGDKPGQRALFESSAVDPEVVQDVEERRIVIMNPPFTANDKKGRKFTPKIVKALQKTRASDPRPPGGQRFRGGRCHRREQHQHDVHAAGREGPGGG